MDKKFKFAIFSLMLMMVSPVMSQATSDYLKPYDYRRSGSFDNIVCWGEKVEPSFAESYEIKCIYDRPSGKFRVELMVENQQKPHVVDMDEDMAYMIKTLVDVAVYSASNLPHKEWMQSKLDNLKSGGGAMVSSVGLDGETYRFYNRSYGAYCWSPRDGNNRALVSIGQAIYDAVGHKDMGIIRSRLDDIKGLTAKYASLLQEPYREYYLLRIDKKPENWWLD